MTCSSVVFTNSKFQISPDSFGEKNKTYVQSATTPRRLLFRISNCPEHGGILLPFKLVGWRFFLSVHVPKCMASGCV